MIDKRVKHFLKQRGASPSVFYTGLARLVTQWTETVQKLQTGSLFTYDDFANELNKRQLIHDAMAVAEFSTVERYKREIERADRSFLDHALCGVLESGGECEFIASQFWKFVCVPADDQQRVGSGWPQLSQRIGKAVRYEYGNFDSGQIPTRSICSEEKALFILSQGDVLARSVSELKMAGLDPDINQDGNVDTPIESAILFDILADVIDTASEEHRSISHDGRECYFYESGRRTLMIVFDPASGGTAFVPLYGKRAFDNWPMPVNIANEDIANEDIANNSKNATRKLMENLGCCKSKVIRGIAGLLADWEAFASSLSQFPVTWDYYLNRIQERLLIDALLQLLANDIETFEGHDFLARLESADNEFRNKLQLVGHEPQNESGHLSWMLKSAPGFLSGIEKERWQSLLEKSNLEAGIAK